MPNKNGYLPLGHDDPDDQQQEQDQEGHSEEPPHGSHAEHGHNTGHGQSPHVTVTVNQRQESPIARRGKGSDREDTDTQGIVAAANSDTTTTSTTTTSRATTPSTAPSNASRPSPHATASAPAAPDAGSLTSPSTLSSFQFPRFGTKHKSLLGLSSHHSTGNAPSSSSNNIQHTGSSSPYARLVGSKSLGSGLQGDSSHSSSNNTNTGSSNSNNSTRAATASDLAQIRPKQHPHTTQSGPRGIQKSQKREVLREIKPDPHNLPEELLREQARSGAAVDAIANSALYQQQEHGDGSNHINNTHIHHGFIPGSPVGPGSPGGGGNLISPAVERGTLLGSGDGLGLGIGLGGKANVNTHSRWGTSRPGRRQRRVPSSGLGRENDQRVIQSSVFTPVLVSVDDGQPVTPAPALTPDHAEPMTGERFVSIVNSVKDAIHSGVQPLRIAQGSSGSYFCRNTEGKIVGVFKPKNEEPYGQLNPKWAKWIHRNLFPCCFGRSCLIPNLGYISEAATSLVDRRLKLNIVPSTEVVWLSSSAFHYDYLDRRAAQLNKGAKPLPDKVGSFQLFLNGFKDANLFMRDHPWPVESVVAPQPPSSSGGSGDGNGKGKTWRQSSAESMNNGHTQHETDGQSMHGSTTGSAYGGLAGAYGPDRPGFNWTPALQQQFREQFEKMIILDYLIRNTDRGLDNWMIRYCEKEGISIVAGPPPANQKGNLQPQPQQQQQHQQQAAGAARRNSRVGDLLGLHSDRGSLRSSSSSLRETAGRNGVLVTPPGTPPRSNLSRAPSGMEFLQDEEAQEEAARLSHRAHQARLGSPEDDAAHGTTAEGSSNGHLQRDGSAFDGPITMESYYGSTHVHVAAIDNGLAFPFKHPDSWRSYPYGWLFLPRPLISQPFTKATRDHFLPLLSSPVWWRETIADLRRLFSIDSDFDQGMFDKQMAVMKGQGWNIVETLKNLEHGPMDLCRRVALVVWDEEVTLEAGVRASMLAYHPLQQPQQKSMKGGLEGQSYTNTQPKAMSMMRDGSHKGSSYSQYGSIMSAGDRLSNSKTLSNSSTAIGEGTPFLKAASLDHLSLLQQHGSSLKKGSLPHLVINMEEGVGEDKNHQPPKHDSFRQVVSDGEYDLHDDDDDDDEEEDDDEDAFSYDEEYGDSEEDEFEATNGNGGGHHKVSSEPLLQQQLAPVTRDGMVSIDMTLTDPEAAEAALAQQQQSRNHRRRQSHHGDIGTGRSRRSRQHSTSGVSPHPEDGSYSRGAAAAAAAAGVPGAPGSPTMSVNATTGTTTTTTARSKNHRRSRTELDDRTGTIRFDPSVTTTSPDRTKRNTGANGDSGGLESARSSLLLLSAKSPELNRTGKNSFESPEDEPERGRGFFARGYGDPTRSSSNAKNRDSSMMFGDGSYENLNGSERPKWADRLRRGLSFDGHLLPAGVGIGQAARRERKLRKLRQRERELREQRVVLVERIEPVTKNLPYFKWW